MSCLWSQFSLMWHLERRSSSFTYGDIIEPTAYNEITGKTLEEARQRATRDEGQTGLRPSAQGRLRFTAPERACACRAALDDTLYAILQLVEPPTDRQKVNTFLERCKATGVDTPTLCRTHLEVALAAMDMKTSAPDDTLLDRLHTAIAYGTEWDSLPGSNDKLIDSY
ncbi:hypothetical protein AbraIFM66950_000775 [Aspergillus brasiliensis]|nr:hypothetical protein AbraIFM66950_000775 [Aspergillus brasiliensis]